MITETTEEYVPTKDKSLNSFGRSIASGFVHMAMQQATLLRKRFEDQLHVKRAYIEGDEEETVSVYIRGEEERCPWQVLITQSGDDIAMLEWNHLDCFNNNKPDNWEDDEWGPWTGGGTMFSVEVMYDKPNLWLEDYPDICLLFERFLCAKFEARNVLLSIYRRYTKDIRIWGRAFQEELDTLCPCAPERLHGVKYKSKK